MALNLVAASSQFLRTVSPAIAGFTYPFTLLGRASPNATGSAMYLYDFGNSASGAANCFRSRFAGDASNVGRITVGNGVATDATSTSTNFVAGSYQTLTYTGTSGTARSVLLQNAGIGNGSNNLTPTGIDNAFIGCLDLNGARSGFFDGQIAHCAGWTVVLSAAELLRYQQGESPLNIRPASLLFYLPLDNDIIDVTGNTVWTASGSPTFVSTGPGTFIPRPWLL